MDPNSLIEGEAELDDDENEDSFDEETGEHKPKPKPKGAKARFEDSSEEEDDDDDEEAEREVREGFIVDEDEDDEEREARKRERRKRRREEREEEGLDEEDLDLIGEAHPELERRAPTEPKLKRLKRGHREDRESRGGRGIDDIFDSEEEDDIPTKGRRGEFDEFDDFIEEDEFSNEGGAQQLDDAEVARPAKKGFAGVGPSDLAGLDEQAMEDMRLAFGDGTEYDWALSLEEQEEEMEHDPEKPIELKDVFEPSQLAEKMLTEEDNVIRNTDVPERFQIARKPYEGLELTEDQRKDEIDWVGNLLWPKKQHDPELKEPFWFSVGKILEFLTVDNVEIPFIMYHRKDYLIHTLPEDPDRPIKLFEPGDLWDIFELDLKYRALIEKRNSLQRTYDNLKSITNVNDEIFEDMLPQANAMEELSDIQDYLHFQYSSQLRDLALVNSTENANSQRRPGAQKSIFERIRNGKVYNLVRAFGITADAFAQNASRRFSQTSARDARKHYTEDPNERPDDMADKEDILDGTEISTGSQAFRAAKTMFAEELTMSPKFRKVMRTYYYMNGAFDVFRTEKGLRKIDEQHPYYEFKYLRNQQMQDIARYPGRFLRMLKAEEEGLIEIKLKLQGLDQIKQHLYTDLESDNLSEIADAWNKERRDVLDVALGKLDKILARGVRENLRNECETHVAKSCRNEFTNRLDQMPFKPKGWLAGTEPRVLAMSNGHGNSGRDAICWAWVDEDGRVLENGKFTDLAVGDPERGIRDGADVDAFVDLIERRRPDVIGISGFSPETRRLYKNVSELVEVKNLHGPENNNDDGGPISEQVDVLIVNDEVARLYQNSERAQMEHPGFAPLTHYCVGLGRYMQSPLKEYAALGRDIISISFDPNQNFLPQEKLMKSLETALVDMVNLTGVNINDALSQPSVANLLPYVCGLGQRKATQLLKTININGGSISSRGDLAGDPEEGKLAAVGEKVLINCASFFIIDYNNMSDDSDYLDSTRVHPEDYELARKIAADALELDEEDVKAEQDENGPSAVVRKLIKEDAQDKVNDLVLEEYAEQLEKTFMQRKRATLETIREELISPYEELRKPFRSLSSEDVFTMLTGETRESLQEGMIVPISIKRVSDDHIDAKLDCGIDAIVSETELTDRLDISPRQLYAVHQTVQAKIMSLNVKGLLANVSLREDVLRRPWRRQIGRPRGEWDETQEMEDKKHSESKADVSGRTQRVIKHPLFKPFSFTQAEEYLGSQGRGDCVIRPSSKGTDHLCVSWKVADGIYQHIDVLELDKENPFSVGKTLKVAGKWTYSDLDELIANHVRAMARKVDEMCGHEKFQKGSKSDTERWLTTYTEANPKRANYAFCLDPKHPGYFYLCFKAGQHAHLQSWNVRVIPGAFDLVRNQYPDMVSLCNGFKKLWESMRRGGGGPGVGRR
ncbi:MAG: Transcription elongation factor spt6 [Cirrosporium novae-zelandiae]|nr:MAG: Transcription elongation factor spt6 [Cirrosporium novae-zelandiae]